MDAPQALSLIGFDGPDSSSTKEEFRKEIERLEAAPKPHHPLLTDRIRALRSQMRRATGSAFQPPQTISMPPPAAS